MMIDTRSYHAHFAHRHFRRSPPYTLPRFQFHPICILVAIDLELTLNCKLVLIANESLRVYVGSRRRIYIYSANMYIYIYIFPISKNLLFYPSSKDKEKQGIRFTHFHPNNAKQTTHTHLNIHHAQRRRRAEEYRSISKHGVCRSE